MSYRVAMRVALVALALAIVLAASPASAEKSRKTALVLSGLSTGVSSALVLSSFLIKADGTVFAPTFYAGVGSSVITPSLGQWYAGKWLSIGMAVRVAAAGLATLAIAQRRDDPCFVDPTEICPTLSGTGFTVLSLAAIAYIGGVAYDVIDTPKAIERHNRGHAMLTPTLSPRGAGGAIVGQW